MPSQYTGFLAAMQYIIRVVKTADTLQRSQEDLFKGFMERQNRWLVVGQTTPFSMVHRQLQYGIHCAQDAPGSDPIRLPNQNEVIYRGRMFEISALKILFKDVIRVTEAKLSKLIFLPTSVVPDINPYQFDDDQTVHDTGHYFALQHPRFIEEATEQMLMNLSKNRPDVANRMLGRWFSPLDTQDYAKQQNDFLEHLALLFTWTGGRSGRGRETLSVIFYSKPSARRNIVLLNGQFMVATGYHKGQSITDREKVQFYKKTSANQKHIARFLPWEVSRLLLVYLIMVVPFHQEINENFDTDGYLFPAATKELKHTPEHTEEEEEEEEDDPAEDGTNAGHVVNDEVSPTMDTARITALMKRFTRRGLNLVDGFGVRDWRQIQAAIDSDFIHSALARVQDGERQQVNVGALQATHSGRTDGLHYGGQDLIVNTAGVNIYRGCSDDHQLYFGLTPRPPREKWGGVTPSIQVPNLQRTWEAAKAMALEGLMKVYKSCMWLSAEQEDATVSILEGQCHNLVCVLGTGSGKTGLIMIPALMEDQPDHPRTTIVIVPTVALAGDIVRTCTEKDIGCIQYDHAFPHLYAPVVVVVSETATTEKFMVYTRQLYDRKRLSRIVFDECHTIEMDSNYRQKFRKLRQLDFSVQNVFLTATLPPTACERFRAFCQLNKENTRLIRAQTNRLGMKYEVRVVGEDSELETELAVEIRKVGWEGGNKGIVFTRKTKEAEEFARRVGSVCRSTAYHAHLDKKDENLQGWIEGKYDVIVGTSGLGLGINVKKVSDAFHLGVPYKISDFFQQSGRAGRGGENVRSVIFVSRRTMEAMRKRVQEGGSSHDEAAMIQFILTNGCRRVVISKFMDGEDKQVECGNLEGAASCDNCERSDSGFETESGFWESSSTAAPTPRSIAPSRKRSRTEYTPAHSPTPPRTPSTWFSNTPVEPHTEPMSMDLDDDDVPGIPQVSLGEDDEAGFFEDDDDDPYWFESIGETLHSSSTSAPIDGSKIRQRAITYEQEEEMVTMERISVLLGNLVGQCIWCWGKAGGERIECRNAKNSRHWCKSSPVQQSFPVSEFERFHNRISHLSCAGCKMPVDFCKHGGVNCKTLDVVTPFVWGQYAGPKSDGNRVQKFIGNYLTTHAEGISMTDRYEMLDPKNVLGLAREGVMSREHMKEVAIWLGSQSGKGVAGKTASNLFMVFVEVAKETAF
jgi:superfamily II DNA/RNA helicase